MANWLKNVAPTKSKLSAHIDQDLIEQFKNLLAYFQESQPGAELDHMVEQAMTDYLNGNKPHMKAYKAWLKEKEAQAQQEAAQEPQLQESAKSAKARPAVSLASGDPKMSREEILQRAYKDKDSSVTAT